MAHKGFYEGVIGGRLRALGVDPGRKELGTLAEWCGILEAGRALGAVAKTSGREDIARHVVDALSCLLTGAFDGPRRVVDVGSGGGLPGIPLAIMCPESEFVLVDSTRKKVDFVIEAARSLMLENVSAVWARVEEYGRTEGGRESFDVAVVRAVGGLPVVEEYALPLVRLGGCVVAQKGRLSEKELAAGVRAADELGGGNVRVVPIPAAAVDRSRCIVLVDKLERTPGRYPRRPGVARRRPLGE